MYRFTDTEGAKPMVGLIALLNVKRFENQYKCMHSKRDAKEILPASARKGHGSFFKSSSVTL